MKGYNKTIVCIIVLGMMMIPFGYTDLLEVNWSAIPDNIYLEIVFVVVFTTFVAYLLNSKALKELSPTTVSIYIYLQPILASLFAIFWGSDNLDIQKIIAAIFIFLGVYLVSVSSFKNKTYKLS